MGEIYLIRCEECGVEILENTGTAYCCEHGPMEVVDEFFSEEVIGIDDLHEEVRKLTKEVRELKKKLEKPKEIKTGRGWAKTEEGYKCKKCGKVFKKEMALYGHLKSH